MDYYHEIYAIISFCKDMIKIGQINNLRAVKKVDFGFYLDGEEFGEILLPTRYVPEGLVAGDDVEVFIYRDSEGRLIATTDRPLIEVGEFALLKVSAVNNVGAFMEIGVMKDLLVPYREQREPMLEGKFYVVYAYIDRTTNRIVGSTKLNKFVGNKVPKYSAGDSVRMIVVQKTDLGYKVIVDNLHWGMVYNNDVFDVVRIGDVLLGYVKLVREDGKIDVTFREQGGERVFQLARRIEGYLTDNNGSMRLCDSSHPDDIRMVFQCSKKDFKKALGYLFKHGKIDITERGVCLRKRDL